MPFNPTVNKAFFIELFGSRIRGWHLSQKVEYRILRVKRWTRQKCGLARSWMEKVGFVSQEGHSAEYPNADRSNPAKLYF
jgi:molybdate-binding protein